MKDKIITVTTDFHDEFAIAQLHAVAATLGYEGRLIENHSVTPFAIQEGAFQIDTLSKFTPLGAVHLGVVDPGVGSKRLGIIIKNHKSWFVGPDNGLLYQAAKSAGIDSVWEIREKKVDPNSSNTFHGRDIFIKAAIYLSKGILPETFGGVKINPKKITKLSYKNGQILHIDVYGNVKIHFKGKIKTRGTIKLKINGKEESFPIVKTFSDVPPGRPLAYRGSNGTLELAINLGNLAATYGLKTGKILKIL